MSEKTRILVVDDEQSMCRVLSIMLKKEGCDVETASSRSAFEAFLDQDPFDMLITDMKMPDLTGLDVLNVVSEKWPETRMIVMTAFPSTDTTIQAIQKGALDYITKEGDYLEKIRSIVREAERKNEETPSSSSLLQVRTEHLTDHIIGDSSAMLEICKVVGRVANLKSTVLLTGESGTGKELIARAIHYHSLRRERPLVGINCGALTETLLESELFGHVRGSFTGAVADKKGLFEAASGGTFFLDEIGETSKSVQVKLLRVLQEEKVRRVGDSKDIEVDARIIAATNQDLSGLIRQGAFREDLFFRLNVIPIHLPPLRERREDIPKLAGYFLEKYCRAAGQDLKKFDQKAMELLKVYAWPGNVRELENVIERIAAMEVGGVVLPASLPDFIREGKTSLSRQGEGAVPDIPPEGIRLEDVVEEYERKIILKALEMAGDRRSKAAELLGLSARSFRYRLDKYGL
jgi:two-component system response regulator PilR (NtrC family)